MTTIDFTQYSVDELIHSLENVDDQKYPDNALLIYKTLLLKLNLTPESANTENLGYAPSLMFKTVFTALSIITPTAAIVLNEFENKRDLLSEKIMRLNSLLKAQN